MRFMFIYPNITRPRTPQMGILALGSHLKHHGVDVAVCDLTFHEVDQWVRVVMEEMDRWHPDMVGISLRTLEFSAALPILEAVGDRKGNTLVVAGGPHATYVPQEVAPLVDYGVMGDGEDACLAMARVMAEGRVERIRELPNVFFQHREELVKNPVGPMFDLALAPIPHYELFDERHYTDHCFLRLVPGAKVCGVFEGSRGCPYLCTYCSNAALMEINKGAGKWRREKNALQLRREMDAFSSRYGMDMMYFIDEVVMTSDRRTAELRDHLGGKRTPFIFMERPELIRENRVRDLKEAGAWSCSIGIESGDEEFRKLILKRNMPDRKILDSYRLMREYGIRTHAFVMMGMPDQSEAVMRESIRLLQTIQPDSAQATTFYPLPATQLYGRVMEMGLFDPKVRPSNYYSLSALNYSSSHKEKIAMYADMVNLELWRDSPIHRLTVQLCMIIPQAFRLVRWYLTSPRGHVRYQSIRKMTAKQFLLKIWGKVTERL
ncbi:MAG: B12-binding domain-containing radical SAM protein [Magnetococcales bacterium]|nr:B12-binding domain-containing radical SAM protein [Magnetococcales bacterium]MBF0150532.1 B12-binding domain-containing radical SAM protein [Magnetococcales bacterium]MBF0174769.1 B12-binding domain-containing radical SAM protein [Magnetococcales bacterium]MBF0347179.1 B12-binding domain-containing radical SAM protein [Magnetococcales bacterium]MBF0631014.1 B12-binding domain-containing radical SAM protein [Magnetococcales bacterium]